MTSQFAEVDLHPDVISNEHMRFRLHDHQCRFLLEGGTAEDVTTIGGQLDDHDTFDETIRRVTTAGVPVTEGTDEGTALRRVERLLRFPGPKGLTRKIFTTAKTMAPHLRHNGFVTGASGMGR